MDFITPGFLAAGLAAAVPIVIHLLFRRRARRVDLGSLRFLQQALRDHAHRRKVRRWLLLLARIAAVLLLALLFARPFFPGAEAASSGGEWLVAIDQSASMSAQVEGTSRFSRAQDAADKLLKGIPEGTSVQVAYFDAAGVSVLAKPEPDRSRKPTLRGTDYAIPLKWARDLLWRSQRPGRRLVLITDLQNSALRATKVPEFPRDVTVELIDVGRPVPRNLAVAAVTVPVAELRPNMPLTVVAEVRNTGAFPERNVAVKLSLSGAGATFEASQTVSVGAGKREPVRFEVPLAQPALYQGSVTLAASDELPFDNRRFLAFEAKTADRVLLVNGEPGATVFAAETYFLEMALRLKPPEATAQPITPFDPETIQLEKGLPDLAPFSAVVLANVERLDSDAASSLAAWVEQGGQLVVFGGGNVEPDAYAQDVFPANVLRIGDAGLARVQTWDKSHPLLAGLSDPQHGDLRSVSVRRILELEPKPNSRVLIRDQAERPLLVEGDRGKGRVLFFAMAADREWGDWPTHRLFVPLMHQAFRYVSGRLTETARVEEVDGDQAAGIASEGDRLIVRNPDPRESDVARISEAALRQAYKLSEASPRTETADARPARAPGSQRPSEIGEWIAWILLAVLVLETFLANRTHG